MLNGQEFCCETDLFAMLYVHISQCAPGHRGHSFPNTNSEKACDKTLDQGKLKRPENLPLYLLEHVLPISLWQNFPSLLFSVSGNFRCEAVHLLLT